MEKVKKALPLIIICVIFVAAVAGFVVYHQKNAAATASEGGGEKISWNGKTLTVALPENQGENSEYRWEVTSIENPAIIAKTGDSYQAGTDENGNPTADGTHTYTFDGQAEGKTRIILTEKSTTTPAGDDQAGFAQSMGVTVSVKADGTITDATNVSE
ncbi:MAG: protease inhibitor I42 family protein [Eubacteriaceae bacterium]|nr:protease inhibitor I42 family protein [Eubacteriaceae bacterium]